ncbi:MAG: SDR family oxidoreductase [Comamonadaceae bacterium]|nr:SDR family oxidoreductase [Comamonadaceae bacterium]
MGRARHGPRARLPRACCRACWRAARAASSTSPRPRGLLSQAGDTPYSATKHAAVGLAESLAITYGDRGIQVSVVCPQYVATAITGLDEATAARHAARGADGRAGGHGDRRRHRGGRFLILTHPEVLGFFQRKAADYDRWLAGMRRVARRTCARAVSSRSRAEARPAPCPRLAAGGWR